MIVTTPALVLKTVKYGDTSIIVRCFTEALGPQSYLLRGIRKSKKQGLRMGLFQPLTQLEIVANNRGKGTLETLKSAKIIQPYNEIHLNHQKAAMVLFLSEVLHNSLQDETPNKALFDFSAQALTWLDSHDQFANFHVGFLLQLSKYLGFFPNQNHSDATFFDLEEGAFSHQSLGYHSHTGAKIDALKIVLGTKFDEIESVRIKPTVRQELLQLLLAYFQIHLQGFYPPRSLDVFYEVFK